MFEFTLVQKLMLAGLGLSYLWFFQWIWRNSSSFRSSSGGLFARFKRRKSSTEDLAYNPGNNYFNKIVDVKKRFGR